MDARALSTIQLCFVDEVILSIMGEEMEKVLWRKMGSLYMRKFVTNQIYLKRQLYSLRMKEGKKIDDHLNAFNTQYSSLLV